MKHYRRASLNRSDKFISLTYRRKLPQVLSQGCDSFLRKYEIENQLIRGDGRIILEYHYTST